MKRYKVSKGFIVQKLDGKTTIFDGEKSMLYTFNETATFVFQKLKLGKSIEDINAIFIKKYGISKEKAEKDIKELLKDLLSKKIISII